MTAPVSYTYATAAAATGLGVTSIKRGVQSGALKAKRLGPSDKSRIIILHADLMAWLAGLEDAS